jgi:hypothetical protein
MTTLNLAHLVVAREIYASFEDVYLTPLGMSSASHKRKDASWLSIQTKRLGFQSFKDGGRGTIAAFVLIKTGSEPVPGSCKAGGGARGAGVAISRKPQSIFPHV